MKNKLHFIFPRLIGATVVVGIAALVVVVLFKLLIGLVLIAGIAALFSAVARQRRQVRGGYITSIQGGPFESSAPHPYNRPISVTERPNVTVVPIN
jgi:hypothetical protein